MLTIAFGPLERIRAALADVDLLVLGQPERAEVSRLLRPVEEAIGRPVQVTFRDVDWIDVGTGSFHDTVVGRPMIRVLPSDRSDGAATD